MVPVVVAADPGSREALALMRELSGVLERLTGDAGLSGFEAEDLRPPHGVFLIALDDEGAPIGCGGFRRRGDGAVEIKRMFARPGAAGVGTRILAALERRAVEGGHRRILLSTRRVNARAVRFYERRGYEEIAPYGAYVGRPESICMARVLTLAD